MALPDTFDGIRWEIGRLVRYVQDGRKNPVVIQAARLASAHYAKFVEEMSAREGRPVDVWQNKVVQLEGLFLFCRHHFFYVNDPEQIEVVSTPENQVRQTRVAIEVLRDIMEPFYRAMEARDPSFYRGSYTPPRLYIGDCDEAIGLLLAMAAALQIVPVRFVFGGNGGQLHHVWARAYADGQFWDADLTERRFNLGEKLGFEAEEELEVPLDEK